MKLLFAAGCRHPLQTAAAAWFRGLPGRPVQQPRRAGGVGAGCRGPPLSTPAGSPDPSRQPSRRAHAERPVHRRWRCRRRRPRRRPGVCRRSTARRSGWRESPEVGPGGGPSGGPGGRQSREPRRRRGCCRGEGLRWLCCDSLRRRREGRSDDCGRAVRARRRAGCFTSLADRVLCLL